MIKHRTRFNIIILLFVFVSCIHAHATNTDCSSQCQFSDCEKCTSVNISCCPLLQENCQIFGKTEFSARSQSFYAVRRVMTPSSLICSTDHFTLTASAAFEYQQIFHLKDCSGFCSFTWFNPVANKEITYGLDDGSPGVGKFDVNALNFGVTASGNFSFCPTKSDAIIDLELFLGFDGALCGLWARASLPLTHTRWELNINEVSTGESSKNYPPDSVGEDTIKTVFDTMKNAFKGDKNFGDAPALQKGKICGRRTLSGVANMRLDLGYDWYRSDRARFGTSVDVYTQTGTRPCADYLFNAVLGSGFWEVGVGIVGAYKAWQCNEKQIVFSFDATINTMLKSRQNRLLGLLRNEKTNPWSQYLLLKQFNASGQAIGLERAANVLAAGNIIVKNSIEADVAALMTYNDCDFFLGIGYEFWGRSAEQIAGRCFNIPENTYGIKGGTQWNGNDADPRNNQTASQSTISQNAEPDSGGPVFISNDNLDYCVALHPSAITNSIFGFVGYQWKEACHQPYVTLGGHVEFASNNRIFSTWGAIVKGGAYY